AITVQMRDHRALLECVVIANENDFGCRCHLADFIGSFDTIHFRHDDVEHNYIRVNLSDSLKRYLPVLRLVHLPILLSQERTQGAQHPRVVAYNENRSGGWHALIKASNRTARPQLEN